MALDPASVSALISKVATRTDDLTFTIKQRTPSAYRLAYSANIPASLAAVYAAPEGTDSILFSYVFRYRLVRFAGHLASSAVHTTEARGILAGAALFEIESFDLRYPLPGTPTTIPWTAPYGNKVTSRPSAVPESLLIALASGWKLPGT